MQYYSRLAYHDYEGIALDHDERPRLVRDLGDKRSMILRNHGLLTAGRTIPEAFSLMFYLERACEIQIAALEGGAELVIPPPEVCEKAARQSEEEDGGPIGDREWAAHIRMLDREDQSYRSENANHPPRADACVPSLSRCASEGISPSPAKGGEDRGEGATFKP